MLSAFLAGVLGGFVYCLPLSAVNVEIIRRGLTNGFLTALVVSMGALVGDAVWIALAVLGAEIMLRTPAARIAIGVLGIAVLLYLAWSSWRHAAKTTSLASDAPPGAAKAFGLGVMLCLASPQAVFVLLAVMSSVGAGTYASGAARFALYAGIIGGAVIYGFLASGLSAWGRRFVTPGALRIVDRVAAVVFFGLAAMLAVRAFAPVTVG
jgi:chemosensory pili system protein ChpE